MAAQMIARPDEGGGTRVRPGTYSRETTNGGAFYTAGYCGSWIELVWEFVGLRPQGGDRKDEYRPDSTDPKGKGMMGRPHLDAIEALEDRIKPGDWLWLNNNTVKGHSVMFVRWVSPGPSGRMQRGPVQYRQAVCVAQEDDDFKKVNGKYVYENRKPIDLRGGAFTTRNLGTGFLRNPFITPVTGIFRPKR